MRHKQLLNSYSLACAILILALVFITSRSHLQSQQPGKSSNDSALLRFRYKPGAYFPEGFPLHGQVRLLSEPVAEAGARTRVLIEYEVGDIPLTAGTRLEVWKHFTSDVEEFQTQDPNAPAYFNVRIDKPGVRTKLITYTNWIQRNKPSVFPYRKVVGVEFLEGELTQGDKLVLDLGGRVGFTMQHYAEELFNFRIVLLKGDEVLGYGGDAMLKVHGGSTRKLKVVAPPRVGLGDRFAIEIVPQDSWGSPAKDGQGLSLHIFSDRVRCTSIRYDEELKHYLAENCTALKEGVERVQVSTGDGLIQGMSNPIWVERNPVWNVYYGDLHQHTYLHDGRGVFEELYLFARRFGLLDFGAITPHHVFIQVRGPRYYLKDLEFRQNHWPEQQRATRSMNGWKGFVSILAYEYSVRTRLGGHHNVFYKTDKAPTVMELDPEHPVAPIAQMLKTLRLVRQPTLVIPHIGGGPPDWSHPTDPRIERLFEIASVHGVFEESWQKHLAAGLRLGASASGDTHTVSFGEAYPGLIYVMTNALTGVYASSKNREAIWEGLYTRRTFATTGNQRILLEFRVNDTLMGGELPRGHVRQPIIQVRVSGTSPLVDVEVVKNNRVIHSVHPALKKTKIMRIIWGDNLYQRRACVGLRSGSLEASQGRLQLIQFIHRDQAFETMQEQDGRIEWQTASVSNDRDGALVDLSGVKGEYLIFRHNDEGGFGLIEVRIPLKQLYEQGSFQWQGGSNLVTHPYLEKMGIKPRFTLRCDLVDPRGPMDVAFTFQDLEEAKPGDFYYLRIEQLDTNKAWSSPVWVN